MANFFISLAIGTAFACGVLLLFWVRVVVFDAEDNGVVATIMRISVGSFAIVAMVLFEVYIAIPEFSSGNYPWWGLVEAKDRASSTVFIPGFIYNTVAVLFPLAWCAFFGHLVWKATKALFRKKNEAPQSW